MLNFGEQVKVPVEGYGSVVTFRFPPLSDPAFQEKQQEYMAARQAAMLDIQAGVMGEDEDLRDVQKRAMQAMIDAQIDFFNATCLGCDAEDYQDGEAKPLTPDHFADWLTRIPADFKTAAAGQFGEKARLSAAEVKNLNGRSEPVAS